MEQCAGIVANDFVHACRMLLQPLGQSFDIPAANGGDGNHHDGRLLQQVLNVRMPKLTRPPHGITGKQPIPDRGISAAREQRAHRAGVSGRDRLMQGRGMSVQAGRVEGVQVCTIVGENTRAAVLTIHGGHDQRFLPGGIGGFCQQPRHVLIASQAGGHRQRQIGPALQQHLARLCFPVRQTGLHSGVGICAGGHQRAAHSGLLS